MMFMVKETEKRSLKNESSIVRRMAGMIINLIVSAANMSQNSVQMRPIFQDLEETNKH